MRYARPARNVAIIMVLALFVAFVPSGGNAVDAIVTAITMGFLAGISWMLYALQPPEPTHLGDPDDRRRAILYSALGMLVLLIAGTDQAVGDRRRHAALDPPLRRFAGGDLEGLDGRPELLRLPTPTGVTLPSLRLD